MKRKYGDCKRKDGDCTQCSLVNYNNDCHGRPITKLEWARMAAGMSQKDLSAASGVNARQLQRIECGEAKAENLTAKNLLAIADALNVDPRTLV